MYLFYVTYVKMHLHYLGMPLLSLYYNSYNKVQKVGYAINRHTLSATQTINQTYIKV